MNIQDLGAIGELIGALAVLITLVYLAVQTRQAAKGAAAQAPQWVSDGFRNYLQSLRADPEMTRLVRVSFHHWDLLSHNDQARVSSMWTEAIVHLDAILALSEQGFVDEGLNKAWVDHALGIITTPGGQQWWLSMSFSFNARVRTVIEQRLADTASLPPPFTVITSYQLDEEDYAAMGMEDPSKRDGEAV